MVCDRRVTITMQEPAVGELAAATETLARWQDEGAVMQLHPGDIGWFGRFGPAATAAAVRTWSRAGRIVALGLLDGPALLRMTIAPDLRADEELANRLVRDLGDPAAGVLPAGSVSVEAPMDARLQQALLAAGWLPDEEWSPLRRDLAAPVAAPALRVEVVGPDLIDARVEVHRGAFPRATLTADRWRDMAASPPYDTARCLLGFDERGTAVAAVTVWSAGAGRPGLIEPMGVHQDHRGHGYGRDICVAAALELQRMDASSVVVATPSANVPGVATYRSAGFEPFGSSRDLRRPQ